MMFQNKKFGFYAVTLCITGLLYTFLCAGLQSGQMLIIRSAITAEGGGWTTAQIQLPMTVGSILAVPAAFLCCTAFLRAGVRQTLLISGAAAALGCLGLVCANGLDVYGGASCGLYPLFFLSLALTRCAGAMVLLALAVLCMRWFIRCRGRAMGVVSLGTPLFSAVGSLALANLIQTRLNGDYRPLYLSVAGLLAALALLTRFLLRDRPEDAGLYPDGDGRAPASEPEEPEEPATLGGVLKNWRTWLVLLSMGALAAAATGYLDYLEARLLAKAGGGVTLLVHAGPWLALGAILGIPASYFFGWLCDKLGAVWTATLLAAVEMAAVFVLWHFPKDVSVSVGISLSLSLACLMGGVSTVIPCVIARVFGRQQLLPFCRILLPALLIPAALSAPLGGLLGGGVRSRLYLALFLTAAAGLVLTPLLHLARPGRPPKKQDPGT